MYSCSWLCPPLWICCQVRSTCWKRQYKRKRRENRTALHLLRPAALLMSPYKQTCQRQYQRHSWLLHYCWLCLWRRGVAITVNALTGIYLNYLHFHSRKKKKKPDMLEFCFLWKEVKIDSNARNILCICIPLEFNYIPSSAADEWHICVIPIAVTTMSPAWRPSCFLTERSKEETCCWDLEAMGAPSLSAPGRTWTGTHTNRTQI